MTLLDFIHCNEMSHRELAARLGVPRSSVRKWIYGERMPRPEQVELLMKVTDGAVRYEDLVAARKVGAS